MFNGTVKYEALFFDFDGVLVDSVDVKARAFAHLFEAQGSEIVSRIVDHHNQHGGMTRVEKFRHYYEAFLGKRLDEAGLADLCQRFSNLVVDEVVAAPELPGAEDFLDRNYRRIPCFVVSATPNQEIIEIVKRRDWSHYFKKICGVPPPKAEMLGILIEKYTLNPLNCVFFGDAESDYLASQVNGIPFCGILPDRSSFLLRLYPHITWFEDFSSLSN